MRIRAVYIYADYRISMYIMNIRVRIHRNVRRISKLLPSVDYRLSFQNGENIIFWGKDIKMGA